VPLAVGLCKFDTRGLGERAADGPLADTALLFQYLTAEGWNATNRGRALGAELLKRHPLCHRVADYMARSGELGSRRAYSVSGLEALTNGFREELERANGLPREVARLTQDDGTLDELLAALEASGREAKDRAEVSWAVAARVTREARFTLAEVRLEFLKYALAVPADDLLADVQPLVAGHPLAPVLAAYSTALTRQPDALRKELRKAPVAWYTARQENRGMHAKYLAPADVASMRGLAAHHGDALYTDLMLAVKHAGSPADTKPHASRLLTISPYAPFARASLIGCDWGNYRDFAALWEKECQHPVVTKLLAERALMDKRTEDAERLLLKTLDFGKDIETSSKLADMYLARGDEDRWRATLEESLEAPAEGLEHAKVQVKLALHYAGKKEFATARKYAEPAAETWAAWAMLCASLCAEGDGDYVTAELWMRRTSERYSDSLQAWYYWCLRTGRGDLGKARAMVEGHLKVVGTPKTERDRMLRVMLLLADDQPADAAPLLEGVFESQKDGFYLMLAAAAWDRAGDTGKRDRLLKALPSKSDYTPLAKLLLETSSKGEKAAPDEKRIEEVINGSVPGLRPNLSFFAAEFLRRRGQRESSNRFYKDAQDRVPPLAIGPPLAGVALRSE